MQTIGPMNSNSVLFCSVRDNCVLKSILKSFNVIIGLDPIIYSHKKDRYARCCYDILRAVFLRFFENNGCLLMLTSDVLPSLAVCLEKQAILHLENNYGLHKTTDYCTECF